MSKHEEVRRPITVPVLTKEQAQALENLRLLHSDPQIFHKIYSGYTDSIPNCLRTLSPNDIRIAVMFGYDIEISPEERIADEYTNAERTTAVNKAHAFRLGLIAAWNIFKEGEKFPFDSILAREGDE